METDDGTALSVNIVDGEVSKKLASFLSREDDYKSLINFCDGNPNYALTYVAQIILWGEERCAYDVIQGLLSGHDEEVFINEKAIKILSDNTYYSYSRLGVNDIRIPFMLAAKTLEVAIRAANGWKISGDLPIDGEYYLGQNMKKMEDYFLKRMFTPT